MELHTIIFYVFIAIASLSALSIIFIRNVLYAALLLIVTLLSLAGIYILLFAEFIAVTQMLIYAGGVLVILLFGIMLSTRLQGKPVMSETRNKFSALIIGAGSFALLFLSLKNFELVFTKSSTQIYVNQVNEIGVLLMSDWLLPFEVAGVLLLISLVGATAIAKTTADKN